MAAATSKRTRVRRATTTPPLADAVLPKAALQAAFVRCVALVIGAFTRLGLDRASILRGLKDAPSVARQTPYSSVDAELYRRLFNLSAILTYWHTEPAYLDDSGRPRPLAPTGRDGFEALSRRCLPREAPDAVAAELIGNGNLRRLPDSTLQPVRSYADVPYFGQMQLDRMQVRINDLFANVLYNHVDRGTAPRRVDREVTDFDLPVRVIPDFDDMLKRTATLFTDQVNQWMMARSRRRKPDEPTARVSLHLYAAMEANATTATSKPRRARPRSVR